MPENANTMRLIGRIAALCLFILALAYGIGGTQIEYAFASDPLGPRVMPVALAIFLAIFCLFYVRNPGPAEAFPTGLLLVRILAVPVVLIISVLLFEYLGFGIAIFILTFGTGLIFGASLFYAAIGAVGHAVLWWTIFDYLLQVYLPVGKVFG